MYTAERRGMTRVIKSATVASCRIFQGLLVVGCLSLAGIHVAAAQATYLATNSGGQLTESGSGSSYIYNASTLAPSNGTTCILSSATPQLIPEPFIYFVSGTTNHGSDMLEMPNCSSALPIYKQTPTGFTVLSPGDIQNGNTYTVRYSRVKKGFIFYTYPTLSVLNYGARPIETVTGTPDSAAPFQTLLSTNLTNVTILVPPGTYYFTSESTSIIPCCATNTPAVLISNQSNFIIGGYGANIRANIFPQPTTAIMFSEDHDFLVKGLTIQADWQPPSSTHDTGISVFSNWNFGFSDIHFTGNYYAPAAAFSGDWLVNGKFENITMDSVGVCTDFAFLQNITFKNIQATGLGPASGEEGQKCFSVIADTANYSTSTSPSAPPLVNSNNTAVPSTTLGYSNQINIENSTVTNFATGALIESGTNVYFARNYWYLNPGAAPPSAAPGVAILLYYNCKMGGTCPSEGVPPSNITIDGDTFENNAQICCAMAMGTISASSAVSISSKEIANCGCVDHIDNVIVKNSSFANNAGYAIETNAPIGSTYTTNPSLFGNVISAESSALSYLPIGPNLLAVTPRIVKGNTIITVFSNLPTCSTASSPSVSYLVTDAATPTYGGALMGGGSASVLAFCNGSSWVTR